MVSARQAMHGLMLATAAMLQTSAAFSADAPPRGPEADRVTELRRRLAEPTAGDTLVIAHRSCWKTAPENSLAALRDCIRLGVEGVEFDVRHSRDGVAVVIHDDTVDRTTNGRGKVDQLTLAQLKALRLKPGNGDSGGPLTGETIPTLVEFLEAAKGKVLLVFDVKDWTQQESFAVARRIGVDRQAIFFYECSNDQLLARVRPFWDQAIVFPITFGDGPPIEQSLAACPSNPKGMVHAKFDREATLVAPRARAALTGKRVWVATMRSIDAAGHGDAVAIDDPDAHWGWLIRAGANMVMTDEPEALLAYLRRPQR